MSHTIRAKNYFLSHRQLLTVLNSQRIKEDNPISCVEIASPLGLPEDAKVAPNGVVYTPRRQGFEVLVISSTFPEITLNGEEIPIHDPMDLHRQAFRIDYDSMTIKSQAPLQSLETSELKDLRKSIDEELYDRQRRGK